MKKRPTSVTVIAWILMVTGGLSAVASLMSLNNPVAKEFMSHSLLPVSAQYAMMFVGFTITVVSGASMLKGLNWSRYLYVIWSIIGFLVGITTTPIKVAMIPGIIFFMVIVFYLFSPKTNEYFIS